MFLCFMRHGKAEPLEAAASDSMRSLTQKGKQQVTAMASLAKRNWPAGETHIWTSPFVRAQETGLIMNRALHAAQVKTADAIAEGDWQTFFQEVLQHETADVVLVIGHVPALGKWMKAVTGSPLDFKAGSLAMMEYDRTNGETGHGTLLFYVQPKATTLLL